MRQITSLLPRKTRFYMTTKGGTRSGTLTLPAQSSDPKKAISTVSDGHLKALEKNPHFSSLVTREKIIVTPIKKPKKKSDA